MVGLRLCTNCQFVLKHLRAAELVVFGGSALLFLFFSYWLMIKFAARGYLLPITPLWMLLIFTYALFIPNQVRRAVLIVGSMAAAPILLMITTFFVVSQQRGLVETERELASIELEVLADAVGSEMMEQIAAKPFDAAGPSGSSPRRCASNGLSSERHSKAMKAAMALEMSVNAMGRPAAISG